MSGMHACLGVLRSARSWQQLAQLWQQPSFRLAYFMGDESIDYRMLLPSTTFVLGAICKDMGSISSPSDQDLFGHALGFLAYFLGLIVKQLKDPTSPLLQPSPRAGDVALLKGAQ